jgi:hypothetical protein
MQLLRLAGNFFGVRMGDENLSASAIRMGSCAKDFVSCFPAFLIQDSGLALGW